jgi:predicted RNA-binding Zn ribbon-like protein
VSISRVVDRFDAGTQPAGRPPAPGRLAFVQAFLNTFWDLDGDGSETWSTPGAYGTWLRARGFGGAAASAGDLDRALELREALRALCRANHDDGDAPAALATLDRIAHAVAPAAALAPSLRTGALDPAGDGPDAACALALGIVFAARADGTFARLKACPHAHCGWAFYDSSRNRSGQWCSMRICGNRTKGEAFRRRNSASRA